MKGCRDVFRHKLARFIVWQTNLPEFASACAPGIPENGGGQNNNETRTRCAEGYPMRIIRFDRTLKSMSTQEMKTWFELTT